METADHKTRHDRLPAEEQGAGDWACAGHLLRSYSAGRRRSLFRWLGRLLVFVIVAGIAGTAGYLYLDYSLTKGPMALDSLRPRIAEALASRAGQGYKVTIGNVLLEKNSDGRPSIMIDTLTVKGENGATILSAPKAAVALDWRALLVGSVKFRRLAVEGLDVFVGVEPDGSLVVSTGKTRVHLTGKAAGDVSGQAGSGADRSTHPDLPSARAAALKELAAALSGMFAKITGEGSQFSSLRHIGITKGRLHFDDRSRNRSTTFDALDMDVSRSGDTMALDLSANGAAGRWQINVSAQRENQYQLKLEAKNITLDQVMLVAGLRNLPVDFDMPMNATVSLTVGLAGDIAAARGSFASGKGYFLVRDRDFEPVEVDGVNGGIVWDRASKTLRLSDVNVRAGGTRLTLSGTVAPPSSDHAQWRVQVESSNEAKLADQQTIDGSVSVGKLQLALRVDPSAKQVVIERFSLTGPKINLLASARIGYLSGARSLRFTGQADPMPFDTAMSLWPRFVAAPARLWMARNAAGGTLEFVRASTNFDEAALVALEAGRPLPEASLDIRYKMSGVRLNHLPAARPLTGVIAEGRTLGPKTDIEFKYAIADLGKGQRITIESGTFSIRDQAPGPAAAKTRLRFTGTMQDLAALLAQPGLRSYAPRHLDLRTIMGRFDANADIAFRVGRLGTDPQVQVSTRMRVTGLRVEKFIGAAAIENGQMDVLLKDGQLSANGTARLLGAKAQIKLSRHGSEPLQANIALTLDAGSRARLGLKTGDSIQGPIGVKLSGKLAPAQALRADVMLDLTRATIADVMPGLAKPAGQAASASFSLDSRVNGMSLNNFVYRSRGLQARGTVELGPAGNFSSARLSQFKMSPGDDLRADIRSLPNGVRVALSGASIDLRPMLAGKAGATASKADNTVQLTVKTRIATGYNGQILANFEMAATKGKAGISAFTLSAKAGRSLIRGKLLQTAASGPTIEITGSDAGTVLSFLDVYKRMQGGIMRLRARIGNGAVSGALDVRNFVLRNEPALRKLVAQGTRETARARGQDFDASMIRFSKLQFGFRRGAGRLEVDQGIISGPEIGLTLDGAIDFTGDRVAMRGTFVPAYGLNNAFARIPLFGPLLGGSKNEGLLGLNFRVSGRASAPVLNINPLSAIAPGFLRKIFGFVPAPNTARPSRQRPPPASAQSTGDQPMKLGPAR